MRNRIISRGDVYWVDLDKENATYNIAIGERSNGKTYACLERRIKNYLDSGLVNQGAIIRRWAEDLKTYRGNLHTVDLALLIFKQLPEAY